MPVHNQFVHPSWTKSRTNGVDNGFAGIHIANYLWLSLTGIGSFFQEYNRSLLLGIGKRNAQMY